MIHCTEKGVQPFAECLRVAEAIPQAELLSIESRNHVTLPKDPNWACVAGLIEFALASAA